MKIEVRHYVTGEGMTTLDCDAVPREGDELILQADHLDENEVRWVVRIVSWVRVCDGSIPGETVPRLEVFPSPTQEAARRLRSRP